jgi:membrane-bound lytic murein transglycosylase B
MSGRASAVLLVLALAALACAQAAAPGTPGIPGIPGIPGVPGTPATPEAPGAPASPAAPASPPGPVAPGAPPAPGGVAHFDPTRPEIRSFIDQLVAQGFEREQLAALFAAAEPQPRIIDAMTRPAETTLQWWEYRARMLTSARIEAGAQLWREHKELLDQVASEYQVEPEYLIAVLGVETQYGRITGRYRVIDALATLSFDYPPRAGYFRKELGEFLLLTREEGLDPLSIRGSYAGAMGALQFMPSSFRKFAVSESHTAHRDLWADWGDIFASTANYLHQAGWQNGAPVLAEAQAAGDPGLVPPERMSLSDTLGNLRAHGFSIDTSLPDGTPALLLAAPQQDAMGYRVGFQNFYAITRYNRSPLYAMAVYDLAQAIRQEILAEDREAFQDAAQSASDPAPGGEAAGSH